MTWKVTENDKFHYKSNKVITLSVSSIIFAVIFSFEHFRFVHDVGTHLYVPLMSRWVEFSTTIRALKKIWVSRFRGRWEVLQRSAILFSFFQLFHVFHSLYQIFMLLFPFWFGLGFLLLDWSRVESLHFLGSGISFANLLMLIQPINRKASSTLIAF